MMMQGRLPLLSLLGWAVAVGNGFSVPCGTAARARAASVAFMSSSDAADAPLATRDVVRKVAVTGATGRTGRLVVSELLSRGVSVVGVVRNATRADEVLGGPVPPRPDAAALEVVACDHSDPDALGAAVDGCDATVWCASGIVDEGPGGTPGPPGALLPPERSVDVVGVPAVAAAMRASRGAAPGDGDGARPPRVVMLSSAGTTRPGWDDAKKERLRGCADIPIVRLNPFGILGLKARSEELLRDAGVPYAIVRPCGLNDDWPAGARPVLSQGDVAVGRINRSDVARVLCDVLSLPDARGKTFEVVGLAGYPPAERGIGPVLARLRTDREGTPEAEVYASYALAQQLLPGEKQDAAALAMGQTYEQLDKQETGRFGQRGKENISTVTI